MLRHLSGVHGHVEYDRWHRVLWPFVRGVQGEHTAKADADAVRKLAREFVAADFYSMDAEYIANVTDLPTCVLSISIDGHEKKVEDYAGTWVGMPAVIKDLEEEVDAFAGSQKWVKGSDEQAPRER